MIGVLNDRKFIVNPSDNEEVLASQEANVDEFSRLHKTVVLSPGKTVSISLLNTSGKFRNKPTDGLKGKSLMTKASKV